MVYQGAKTRIWKYIKPRILEHIGEASFYCEPFGGGMNCITDVPNIIPRYAGDICPFVIALFRSMQRKMSPPIGICSEMQYKEYGRFCKNAQKDNELLRSYSLYEIATLASWGYFCSYNGRFYEGYIGNSKRDYYTERKENLIKQCYNAIDFYSINFRVADYIDMCSYVMDSHQNKKGIFYMDAPYEGTKGSTGFDYRRFWFWCNHLRNIGHYVYISEYNAPEGWTCIWEQCKTIGLNKGEKHISMERLFV